MMVLVVVASSLVLYRQCGLVAKRALRAGHTGVVVQSEKSGVVSRAMAVLYQQCGLVAKRALRASHTGVAVQSGKSERASW